LFDTGHDRESLVAFTRSPAIEKEGARAFASRILQGHLNDLLGNRAAAIDAYEEALAIDPGLAYRHDQWKLVLDRAYVEKCLTAPFVRRQMPRPGTVDGQSLGARAARKWPIRAFSLACPAELPMSFCIQ